jgi:hypothetical protein
VRGRIERGNLSRFAVFIVDYDGRGLRRGARPSSYNTRAPVPEVLVEDDRFAVVLRPRIEVGTLIAMDRPAPWL